MCIILYFQKKISNINSFKASAQVFKLPCEGFYYAVIFFNIIFMPKHL